MANGRRYYACRGRVDKRRRSEEGPCRARYLPADQLDDLVWADLCAVLTDPQPVASALERVQGGAWLPQELQDRQHTIQQGLSGLERQQARLLDAYLGGALELPEFERKRQELAQRRHVLESQHQQLETQARERIEVAKIAEGVESFCAQVRAGLAQATFEQKRRLVELLIDQVVVTNEEVEIRYVMPISPDGARQPFCHLRLDYRFGVTSSLVVTECESGGRRDNCDNRSAPTRWARDRSRGIGSADCSGRARYCAAPGDG